MRAERIMKNCVQEDKKKKIEFKNSRSVDLISRLEFGTNSQTAVRLKSQS